MRPRFYFIIVLVLGILAIPVYSYIAWVSAPGLPCEMVVVDKGAFDKGANRHRGLFALLLNFKAEKHDGTRYCLRKDYYGFVPKINYKDKNYTIRSFTLRDIDSLASQTDILYLADVKGASFSDWYGVDLPEPNPTVIYGGLNSNDYLLIRTMLDKKRKVILEPGTFESPTNPLILFKMSELTGLVFSGWKGKYYPSLDAGGGEVPAWIIEGYIRSHSRWVFTQPGLVFTRGTEIVVLEENVDFVGFPVSIEPQPELKYTLNLESEYPFSGGFEIIEPGVNTVAANIQLDINAIGREKLADAGIPLRFPVMISGTRLPFVYFAADFSYGEQALLPLHFEGYTTIRNKVAHLVGALNHPFYQAIMEHEIRTAGAHQSK